PLLHPFPTRRSSDLSQAQPQGRNDACGLVLSLFPQGERPSKVSAPPWAQRRVNDGECTPCALSSNPVVGLAEGIVPHGDLVVVRDRKSTRLNSSHGS